MKIFDLQSEPYQPTGSISADGIKNQLGRPRFDRLTLLAREAVQNSWDARVSGNGVRFGIAGWELTAGQRKWLLNTAFKKVPSDGLALREQLESAHPASVLAIYDRGTLGLGGPTRADEVTRNDPANFVNLLRNVGQPPTAFRSGGTYGFGKTALFLASQVRTIVVYSQVLTGRRYEQRVMAASLGSQYTIRRSLSGLPKRYTGRHWWGRKGAGNVVDPVTGRDAHDAALALGLRAFEKEETGTTILILLPDFDGREPEDALRFIGSAILRSFWPKMVDGPRGGPTMSFELSWNDVPIAMPKPQDVPPLDGFVKAFANLTAHLGGRKIPYPPHSLHPVSSQRPIKQLGTLSLVRFPPSPRLPGTDVATDEGGPFTGPSRHTALLRGPHFVVNYLDGPPVPYEHAEYAGVFIASDDAEEAFARSEPPTHDDWSPDMLDNRNDRVFVRVAIRRIKDAMLEFTGAQTIPRGSEGSVPLGAFSDLLGGLIPAERGTGARPNGGLGTNTATLAGSDNMGDRTHANGSAEAPDDRTERARVRILEATEPETVSGVPAFTVKFDLDPRVRTVPVKVSALPMVVLEEGSVETEPPAGSQRPRVLAWSNSAGRVIGRNDQIEIPADDTGPWSVAVSIPPDAAVAVEISAQDSR